MTPHTRSAERTAMQDFAVARSGAAFTIVDASGNVLATLPRFAARSSVWTVARDHSAAINARVWVRRDGAVLGSLHARPY